MRKLLLAVLGCLLCAGCRPAAPSATPTPPTATAEPAIGVRFATRPPPTPVVVQTTPTPLPPPTTTPSPTPIIYLIEPGDTLLAIALRQQTTTAEILALNPAIRPELLQIGQPIILPPPATPLAGGALVTPLPLVIRVTQIQLYPAPSGTTWVLGEVQNVADSWAENVRLVVDLVDSQGGRLGEGTAWAVPPLIPPGESAGFALLWPAELPAESQARAGVMDGRGLAAPGQEGDSRVVDLRVTAAGLDAAEGAVSLHGSVENTGERTANQLLLSALLYDGRGRLTGLAQHALPGSLAPGQNLTFTFSAAPPGGTATKATFHVQGLGE